MQADLTVGQASRLRFDRVGHPHIRGGTRKLPFLFWEMLKKGNDAFLATGRPPTVAVCGQRYVFNPVLAANDLNPPAPCPPAITSTPVAGAERSPRLAPAIPMQSDLMAYQGDDPIAR